MRENQIKKINKKSLKNKYSSFEIEEFAEEVKEYNTLLKSIGFYLEKEQIKVKNNFSRLKSNKVTSKKPKTENNIHI